MRLAGELTSCRNFTKFAQLPNWGQQLPADPGCPAVLCTQTQTRNCRKCRLPSPAVARMWKGGWAGNWSLKIENCKRRHSDSEDEEWEEICPGRKILHIEFWLSRRGEIFEEEAQGKKNSLVQRQRYRRERFQLAVYQPANGDFGYIEIIYMLMVGHFFHT